MPIGTASGTKPQVAGLSYCGSPTLCSTNEMDQDGSLRWLSGCPVKVEMMLLRRVADARSDLTGVDYSDSEVRGWEFLVHE